jgi:hypothetical protein
VKTFIDKCVLGEVTNFNEEINDAIDEWHDAPTRRSTCHGSYLLPLHEWLGMSWDEYNRWVQDASYLKIIIKNRRDLKK